MKTLRYTLLVVIVFILPLCSMLSPASNVSVQDSQINIHYDPEKNQTTIKLVPFRIAENNDRYHSVDLSAFYTYSGSTKQRPENVNVELVSVVKARKLNSDLYVVFVIDGKEVHFSSSRSAIPKPVPGRLWVGERMVFSVPAQDFQTLASAKNLAIKMGGVRFELTDEMLTSIRVFADLVKRS